MSYYKIFNLIKFNNYFIRYLLIKNEIDLKLNFNILYDLIQI